MNPTTIAFHHFGCKVNFAEASSISRDFREKGFQLKNHHEMADIYVISSCLVTSVAEKKCRLAIHQARRLNPDAFIAVVGCLPELKAGELRSMEGVDLVLDNSSKFNLMEELEKLKGNFLKGRFPATAGGSGMKTAHKDQSLSGETSLKILSREKKFIPSYSIGDRTRSFLKIQDGCDYFCAYCAIPLARGQSRSDSINHVISTAREIVSKGIKEIVLTGVNIGDFGRHQGEKLISLLKALEEVEGLNRLRISSIEPDLLSDEIIRFAAASEKLMPHFHIPLQSGSDRILKAMKRKYSGDLYSGRVTFIRELLPFACIAADVITGFPGETDSDFRESYEYLEELPVSYMHVFSYSRRENTLASKLAEQVPVKIIKERSRLLHELSADKKALFYRQNKGREVNVLFESDNSGGWMHGFSENYIKVGTRFNHSLINQIRKVRLEDTDMEGNYVSEDI